MGGPAHHLFASQWYCVPYLVVGPVSRKRIPTAYKHPGQEPRKSMVPTTTRPPPPRLHTCGGAHYFYCYHALILFKTNLQRPIREASPSTYLHLTSHSLTHSLLACFDFDFDVVLELRAKSSQLSSSRGVLGQVIDLRRKAWSTSKSTLQRRVSGGS